MPERIYHSHHDEHTLGGKILSFFRRFDYILFLLLVGVTIFGIFVIYGATYSVPGLERFAWRQVIWLGVGIAAFLFMSLIDYRILRQLAWPFYLVIIASLILLPLLGREIKGATSWFAIGSHRIQPSEFAKIAVALCLAHHLASREKPPKKIRDIIVPCLIAGIPSFLILIQPDIGTASLFFPMLLIMLFAGGASIRLILMLVLFAVWGAVMAYPFLKPYQKARIKVFIDPEHDRHWQGYNIRQAEISLGSGGFFGKGWKQGTQTRLRFLPERHTDFIFSSLGEQFGLFGCISLLFLFGLIVIRSVRSVILTRSPFARLLVVGLLACFILHIIFNIGMTLRLFPVTGLPLPLFSYGGSFLLTTYLIFGIINSVSMKRRSF